MRAPSTTPEPGGAAFRTIQSGQAVRLPTEVEWEAGARGGDGRRYAWGDAFDRTKANTLETQVRRSTPVGVFPSGDTPDGATDYSGNVEEWTTSLWGEQDEVRHTSTPMTHTTVVSRRRRT